MHLRGEVGISKGIQNAAYDFLIDGRAIKSLEEYVRNSCLRSSFWLHNAPYPVCRSLRLLARRMIQRSVRLLLRVLVPLVPLPHGVTG